MQSLEPGIEVHAYNKGNASVAASDQLLGEISGECQGVIAHMGIEALAQPAPCVTVSILPNGYSCSRIDNRRILAPGGIRCPITGNARRTEGQTTSSDSGHRL